MWWLVIVGLSSACTSDLDDREALLVTSFVDADQALLRSRPALVAGKYRRMAGDLYSFYRGNLPVFAHDARQGSAVSETGAPFESLLVTTLGDAHPENFGILVASDDTLAFEPNDFDSADRYPLYWDCVRLFVGLALAARLSNAGDDGARAAARGEERSIVTASAAAYADALVAASAGAPGGRITTGGGQPNLDDLFERGADDLGSRDELDLTTLEGGVRRFRRGVIDAAEPTADLVDLPGHARAALPAALERYASTLVVALPPGYLEVLDVVRERGSGVASWPRVRVLLLVRGPSDAPEDDVILELKELADSPAGGWIEPSVYFDGVGPRVLRTSRAMWARPDAESLWGVSEWLGFEVQIRAEREAHKTLRVERMLDELGTVEALTSLARALGALLARIHGLDRRLALAEVVRELDRDRFAANQADRAIRYADRVEADHASFVRLLDRLGPTLGFSPASGDEPSPDLERVLTRPGGAP
jgi:uncharacterized protein (DUF2252 family)